MLYKIYKKEKTICAKKNYNFFLVFFVFILGYSCQKNDSKINNDVKQNIKIWNELNRESDSIRINISLPSKQFSALSIRDGYFNTSLLKFVNLSDRDSIVKKTIARKHDKQIFRFSMVLMDKGKVKNRFEHFYLVDRNTNELNFKLQESKDLVLLNENKEIIVDELHKKYDSLKLFLKKQKNRDTLQKTYLYFKNIYTERNKKLKLELNRLFYNSLLVNENDKVENYIKNLTNPIISTPYRNLMYYYVKDNILDLNYELLNTNNESKEFIKNVSITIFNFLKNEDNKGHSKYNKVKDWLTTTKLYKNDSIYIKKKIKPLDKKEFKQRLKNIKLRGIDDTSYSLPNIIKQTPSTYYLIDFWATWCAPCIGGVKLMNKMDFPKNVKVLSISLDKEKDIEKWKQKTKELKQQYTYWLDEKSAEGKSFLQFIELQSIPRYVLIDKDLNLIDQAFYHPHEPQFLEKLKDVKNNRYW